MAQFGKGKEKIRKGKLDGMGRSACRRGVGVAADLECSRILLQEKSERSVLSDLRLLDGDAWILNTR